MKMYGLRVKDSSIMLGVSCSALCNCDGTSPVATFTLTVCNNIWLINSDTDAELARANGNKCNYSEYYNLPHHDYNPEALEVVSVDFMFSKKG